MTLMLHAGAEPIDYDGLRNLPVPEATATHVPLPHHRLVDLVKATLGMYGHTVAEEHYGVMPDGSNFFGVLSLKSTYGNYTDICGLRNSHTKRFPVGIAFGSRTFVCDNTAFISDHVIKTKHTARLKERLPGLVSGLIEPLTDQREAQHREMLTYQETALTAHQADAATMQMYRNEVIGVQAIADMVREWETPSHDWGDKTAFRLFNCGTFVLTGKTVEKPALTRTLHQVIDGVCTVH
mgnify:CR=1 FL=1